MKDKKRIIKILNLIYKIWKKNPDLRLMQLLGNCYSVGDSYFVEDGAIELKLKEIYKI